jgi:hypothetical protein
MLQDFAWWSGLNAADAKRGIELVERNLEKVLMAEKVYWRLQSREASRGSLHTAHLLPAYDEYFVAYKDRQSVFDPRAGKPALTTWDVLGPTIIINGTVVGTWKRTNDKPELKLTRDLKKHERGAIADAATRYTEFRGSLLR